MIRDFYDESGSLVTILFSYTEISLCKDGNVYASSFMVPYFTLHIIHWLRRFCTEIARLQSGFTCAFRQVGCLIW